MKKILFFAAVGAMLTLGSCQQDNEFDAIEQTSEQATIYASLTNKTRINFVDKDAEGMKLTWSAGDKFTLYTEDGMWAADFELRTGYGETIGSFIKSEGGSVTQDTKYRVVYPATTDQSKTYDQYVNTIENRTQTGNGNTNHLDGMCYMEQENFTYSTGASVDFMHKYALLTVKLDVPVDYVAATHGTPSELTVFNGSRSYNLKLSNIATWNTENPITANIMIEPSEATSRNLVFHLLTNNGSLFERSIATTKPHLAGSRYVANLNESYKVALVEGYPLSHYTAEQYPASNTWIVTDAITSGTSLSGLRAALYAAYNTDKTRLITMVMPEATSIDGFAFEACKSIANISLPEVTSIGIYAFYNCTNLIAISLPKATTIGNYAFRECSALNFVSLPLATDVGSWAFHNCRNITSVNLPKVTEIKNSTFGNCSALTSANMPAATSIGGSAFSGCSALNSANILLATAIEAAAFSDCTALTSVNMPTVTRIEPSAFKKCINLIKVSFPETVSIGEAAFNECRKLSSISLPKTTTIGDYAFGYCSALTYINLPVATSIGIASFGNCQRLTSVDMPMVTSVGYSAFGDCTLLNSISLPTAVSIGNSVFHECVSLTSVNLPKVATIGNYVFEYCEALNTLELGTGSAKSLTSVGTKPFNGISQNKLAGIDLRLNKAEKSNTTADKTWRTYGPFKSITLVD